MRCRINQCRYNRVRLYFNPLIQIRIYLLTDPSVQSFGVYSTTSYKIEQRIIYVHPVLKFIIWQMHLRFFL